MREIKFRVPLFSKDGSFRCFHYWGFITHSSGLWFSGFPMEPETAQELSQQYTGLKDKNEVEIYEGDIIQWWNKVSKPRVVESTDGGWNPFIDDCQTDGAWHYEIIGNIYENPELLK